MDYNKNISIIDTDPNSFSIIKQQQRSFSISIEKDDHLLFCQELDQKLEKLKVFINSVKNIKIKDQTLQKLQLDPRQLQQITGQLVLKQFIERVQKLLKNKQTKRIRRNWTTLDMQIFTWVVCMYAQEQKIDLTEIHLNKNFWKEIGSMLPATNAQSCLFKWLGEKDHKVTMFQWSEEEEKLLFEIQKLHKDGKNKWKKTSEQLFLTNTDPDKIFRTPKQCRQHYTSFLSPNLVKGPWSQKEDHTLLTHTVLNNGQKKWCKLAEVLKGRTQNAIKNRYHLIVSKLANLKGNKNKQELQLIQDYLMKNDPQFQQRKILLLELKDIKQKQQKERLQVAQKNRKSEQKTKKTNKIQQKSIKQEKIIKFQRVQQVKDQIYQQFDQNPQKISAVKEQHNSQQEQVHYHCQSLKILEGFDDRQNNDFIQSFRSQFKEQNVTYRPQYLQTNPQVQFNFNSTYGLSWNSLPFIQPQFYPFYNNQLSLQTKMENQ